ncbi:MAG: hypothetical protein CMJ18_08915 [Phycisphaeraceae bacterium]|nr:hypothetical protein [Phycisphaeraceae bacterium]
MTWNVYLAGEIHSEWRAEIARAVASDGLPVELLAPVTDHATSDECGARILDPAPEGFWRDHQSAKINAIRTRRHIRDADVCVVRFGEKYRQWNAAFDAGLAVASDKPLITLHDTDLDHALKEVDAAALAVARTPRQVASILRYVITGRAET